MVEFGNNSNVELITGDIREFVIDTLYSKINVSKYRYNILYQKELNLLKNNKYHVTLNNFGLKYFVMFINYKNKKYCFYIDKRTLKYDRMSINIENVVIYSVKHCVSEDIYDFTLFDGDLLKNRYEHFIFIICDVYYLVNKNYIEVAIEKKLLLIEDKLYSSYKYNKQLESCSFRINKLHTYADILKITKTTIPSLDYLSCGLVFYPIFSGLRIVYKFSKDEMPVHTIYNSNKKHISTNTHQNNISHTNPENNNRSSYSKSKIVKEHILNYNENNNKLLDNLRNIKTQEHPLNFIIQETDYPDVYDLYLKSTLSENKYTGIAYIPTISHSRYLASIFKNKSIDTTIIVRCKYAIHYKKWIPINNSSEYVVDEYNMINNYN